MDELLKQLPELFSRAHPLAQLAILASLVLGAAYFAYRSLTKDLKLKQLRAERRDQERLVLELQTKLTDSEALAEKRHKEVQRLTGDEGRLSGELQRIQKELDATTDQWNRVRCEANALQQRFDDLQKIDTDVWAAPTEQGRPPFVPRPNRRTRFVAFLNLKGGVGKTTLVANLAGAYATGVAGRPLFILVVDLDYQGTLSNMCVSRNNLLEWRSQTNNRTSHLLLGDGNQVKDPTAVLAPLLAPFEGTGRYARAIIADDNLDHIDFRQQARFAVEHHEVRFHHRKLLHDPYVFSLFDYVFFDCPPRLTTSTVNALTTSDFIVLPTSLHGNDVDAVPRTLRWLDKLKSLPDFQARLAGVVLNRTYRGGSTEGVTKDEKPMLGVLEQAAQTFLPTGNVVLRHVVPNSPDVAKFAAGSVPLGTHPTGHALYKDVAAELLERIK